MALAQYEQLDAQIKHQLTMVSELRHKIETAGSMEYAESLSKRHAQAVIGLAALYKAREVD